MSTPNLDHSHVYRTESGAVVCWADIQGQVFAPPVPDAILAKHPHRNSEAIAAHKKARDSYEDTALDRCGLSDPHAGGIRPAVTVQPVRSDWSQDFLWAMVAVVSVFSSGLFVIVGAIQALRWCHVIR